MQKQYPISEAKNNLPAIIHGVENGSAIQLTRHGKPVAVILSTMQYQQLTKPRTNLWEDLASFRKSVAPSDLLTENDVFSKVRDQSQGRDINLEL